MQQEELADYLICYSEYSETDALNLPVHYILQGRPCN